VELTLGELVKRWSKPDLTRGTLTQAQYHALDKKDRAQKALRSREKDGEAFIPATFSVGGKRRAEAVEALHGFVFDFDGGVTKAEIEQALAVYAYIAYSSFSHRPNDERWRVFLPYARSIPRDDHKRVVAWAQGLFGERFDARSKTLNQLWYTPACPPDGSCPFEWCKSTGPEG
jgi:hypothetical protein